MLRSATLLVLLLASASAIAAGAVGRWTGRYRIERASAETPSAYRRREVEALTEIYKGRVLLEIGKDGAFVMRCEGLAVVRRARSFGKWRRTGDRVVLTPVFVNDHAASSDFDVFRLSEDGRTMSSRMREGQGVLTLERTPSLRQRRGRPSPGGAAHVLGERSSTEIQAPDPEPKLRPNRDLKTPMPTDSLEDALALAFADWPSVPPSPLDEDMEGAIDAEFCRATFAGRSWQTLDEDALQAVCWSCFSYFVPQASVAVFPALVGASIRDVDWMFEFMTLIETWIDHGTLSGLKGALDRSQIDCLTRFCAYVDETMPVLGDATPKILALVR